MAAAAAAESASEAWACFAMLLQLPQLMTGLMAAGLLQVLQ